MMNCKGNKGFSLLEVIIAIAILGMLMLSFLSMFTNGHRWVFEAGDRTDILFTNQSDIEEEIASGSVSDTETIDIKFQGKSTVTVKGDIVSSGNIDAFRPWR